MALPIVKSLLIQDSSFASDLGLVNRAMIFGLRLEALGSTRSGRLPTI